MSPTPADTLAAARLAYTTAHADLRSARAAVLAGDADLQQQSRAHAAGDQALQDAAARQQSLRAALGAAAAREREARAAVDAALAALLAANTASDVDTLSAAFPIVLLPVRLETRFAKDASGGAVLKVRVYPDELMADTHEPPLTAAERAAGEAFWRDGWDPANEGAAWRALVAQFPAPRAAWIAHALTPTNAASRPAGTPAFPATDARPSSWTRAAEARVLPDRWLAVAYKNGAEASRTLGLPIQDPLALSLAPITSDETDAGTVAISSDGLRLDADVAWTVDFDRAVAAGMGMTLPLGAALAGGIDRLVVLGVKASLPPDEAAGTLAALFDAHHYTGGWAFVRQGTPTNNTPEAPSPFPPADPDGASSFAVERGDPVTAPDGNGSLFTRALGLPAALAAHVEGSDLREQPNARAMNAALWPATWKYFLGQLMDPVVPDAAVRAASTHFAAYVRGRGPLPAFRVGPAPYGVLPVSSLARWTTADPNGVEATLAPLLRRLRGIWMAQAPNVPRAGATADADADLLGTLGMEASAREVHARPMLGPELQRSLFSALNISAASATHWQSALRSIAQEVLRAVGHAEWDPRIASMTFADDAPRVRLAFAAPPPLSETAPLQPFNYIAWIRQASLDDLRAERFPAGVGRPPALLYYLLRHAALALYADVGTRIAVKNHAATAAALKEPETPGVDAAHPTVWDRLDRPIPAVSGTKALGRFLLDDVAHPDTKEIAAFRSALQQLEQLPTAELDRLIAEALDTCSHRLDAWITSLAAKRLDELRAQQPAGSHLGAFGWVEDLRPAAGRPDAEPPEMGGFIHAPSMSHAATAAILRNAYVSQSGQPDRYAIDLSSTRVRGALQLLDGVRQGQPLGAVLGYRFERGLHEGHRPLRLEKYIDPFRRLFPLAADKGGDSGEPAESIAARNVVDGLLLRGAAQAGTIAWGQNGLPSGGDDRAAIEDELRALDDAVDAVADLLTAESVFQMVRGNSDKAASVLDALGQGLRPPEPEVVLQPRSGTTATHRVGIALGSGASSADVWPGVAPTPRSLAEPFLDRWVGSLIGDPAAMRCRLRYRDAANQPQVRVVALSELDLRPLDVLALTKTLDADAGSELDARVASLAPGTAAEIEIVYAADPSWDRGTIRTFPDALELARAIAALLAASRALEPADLLPAEEAQAADAADRLPGEAGQRAGDAETALNAAKTALDVALHAPATDAAARTALIGAARFGVPGAFAASRLSGDALLAHAAAAAAELARRSAAAAGTADAAEKARAIFGRDFLFLPRFHPANATELDLAAAQGPALVGDPSRVAKWMQQLSRVRPNLAAWRRVSLLASLLGRPPLPLTIAQLPHAPDARWIGLPFPSEAERPESGRLSLALHRPVVSAAGDPWVGLLVDEWTDIVPRRVEDTAVAFHYDDPGAEAAQAVLVAVPPTQAAAWDLASLLDTLNETLDLAKVRAVDGELLPLGQLLPAIYLAANLRQDTVSTDLRGVLQHPEAIG
jgi:hypothetical protein